MGGAREFITKPSECGSSPPHRQAPEKVDLLRATAAAASSGVIGAVLLFIFSAAFLVWSVVKLLDRVIAAPCVFLDIDWNECVSEVLVLSERSNGALAKQADAAK